MGKHLEQALPSVYTLQCLTGKVDNNKNNNYKLVYSSWLQWVEESEAMPLRDG